MRILFLSRWFPYPANNGAKIRIFNLLRHLAARHELVLLSFASEEVTTADLAVLRQYCRQVAVVPYRPFQPNRLQALAGFFAAKPRSVIDTYSQELHALVEQTCREQPFDLVIASQIDMVPYAQLVHDARKIFEEIELTVFYDRFVRQQQLPHKVRSGLTWWKLSRYVAGLLRAFDGGTVVSTQEQERVRRIARDYANIQVVPNGVDVAHYAQDFGPPEPDTLIYSGALTYGPNFDAIQFFLGEIFPLIQAQRPAVKLTITGKLDGVPVERLPEHRNVMFTGYLDDIRPTLARSWVNIVPLRQGGGTRLKILEALAAGTPVVATAKGAEGLELLPEQEILRADTPAAFAATVLRLLDDADLRACLSRQGRQAVTARYDWSSIGRQFNEFIEAVAPPTRTRPAVRHPDMNAERV
jgi:polysaccharide biosynthesis protein PslH